MAELAFIFHWSPAAIEALTLSDLAYWHAQAITLWNRTNGPSDS